MANLVLKIATAIFGLPRALFSKFATGNRESFTGTFFKFATAKLVCHGQFWTTNCHGQFFGFTGNSDQGSEGEGEGGREGERERRGGRARARARVRARARESARARKGEKKRALGSLVLLRLY